MRPHLRSFLTEIGAIAALAAGTTYCLWSFGGPTFSHASFIKGVAMYPYLGLLVTGLAHAVSRGVLQRRFGYWLYVPYFLGSSLACLHALQRAQAVTPTIQDLVRTFTVIGALAVVTIIAGCERPAAEKQNASPEQP